MVLDGCNTHIETDKWEDIRRKLYYPIDVNEYDGSSKPLIGTRVCAIRIP